ncbi:MAG: transketolase [Paludibacteraceae bacterium]|nr:transketolase [Paludibacteraceae bacterium]
MNNKTDLMNKAANNIRILAAAMVEKAKSGHPGGAMGGSDFINVLFSEFLRYDPDNAGWEGRDRFFLDPGHMAPMLYSQLCLAGKFSLDELQTLRQWGSVVPGHPERDIERGIENTSGPLGQGHVFAVGAAIAAKWMNARFGEIHNPTIYAFISDGGVQEEISQGAGRLAGHLGLDNLIMFYDSNEVQLSTNCKDVTTEDVAKKYEAWGWYVQEIPGNDPDAIRAALERAREEKNHPSLIIGHTAMGKGCLTEDGQSFEGKCSTHGQPLSKSGASFEKTIEHLGGNPAEPFKIFPEVKELYDNRAAELREMANNYYVKYDKWAKANPTLAAQYEAYFSGETPAIDWSKIEQKAGNSTRGASATALSYLAENVSNMIVSSADLSNSDKTDGFLKKTHAFKRDDFSGQFLQSGVSELTMACVCIGMSLHGGVIPACGTFFVFSDYMKPAVRLAALMEVPVIFVWSHDAFRVGEDGPTHEPVEQEAQIRLMEKLKNHSGNPSMLVLRPADADETTQAWRAAIENTKTPSALILSRQDIDSIKGFGSAIVRDEHEQLEAFRKGAYIVSKDENPQVVLLASGSEVATLMAGAELLRQEGIRLQVVSVPSEGRFRQQSAEYQNEVLPKGIKRFGMTAGLPCTLESLVGENGSVWGLESFGFSAPYKILDEKLGFTAANVVEQVKKLL